MRRFLSTMTQARPKRFAPLKGATAEHHDWPKLKGVIFDVDGTLCQPQNHMFAQMRSVLQIPKSVDILEHIYSLPTASEQESAMESIRAIERVSMAQQVAQPGLAELMAYLDRHRVPKGICTRNFEQPVTHLLTKFLAGSVFHPVVTRDFRPPKPDPAGLLFIARSWGLTRRIEGEKDESAVKEVVRESARSGEGEKEGAVGSGEVGDASGLIMVGDSIDDMTAGRRAGAATVLLVNDANRHLAEHEHTDLVIERLDELMHVLEHGFVGSYLDDFTSIKTKYLSQE
ncbi:HAD-like protein [Annulohypoxylon truncatum]|uniref:HAD-like protein n=1 Tax=Annulohypoxylon truncatum TaxID=327061 RepID=UPI00200873FB|nr:HAD-like protein [Annulohypoxylon truncatum]KAI1207288.1 HAD-like protein [Annulohypoxylon truncatum]